MKTTNLNEPGFWTPIKIEHQFDDMIDLPGREFETKDGLNIVTSVIDDMSKDMFIDDYSMYTLTDLTKLNDLLKIELPVGKFPVQFTTSLLCNSYPTITNKSAYLYVIEKTVKSPTREVMLGETSDASTWIWAQDITTNAIYYTVTLHNEEELSINHNDNTDNVFMSLDVDNLEIVFKTVPLNQPTSTEKFNYYINQDNGFLLIYVIINDQLYYLSPNTNTNKIELQHISQANTTTLPLQNVFKFVKFSKNSLIDTLQNNWVSYRTFGSLNNLLINETKSIFDVTNNYLVNYQFKNINDSGIVPANITQLKNQVTTTGKTNRENPFPNMRDCDHREYTKIYDVNDGEFYIGYDSYETEITLLPDRITYFNAPQNMFPLKKLNINDSGLIRRGAIGGDTPITSDKIFKKAATYKYNSPYGKPTDEETGVWLCSWLKANLSVDWEVTTSYTENVFVNWEGKIYKCLRDNKGRRPDTNSAFWEATDAPPPVWVDRYYNPNKYTAIEAMQIKGQYSNYKPKFDHIIETLQLEDEYVFDKISDLTFEPGSLYAYYRVGQEQIKTIIDTVSNNLIHEGLEPVYNQDRSPYVNIDDNWLEFTGSNYLESQRSKAYDNGDFTICFNMSVEDWSKPFAGQFLGNYTNQGVGVFNRKELTPYLIFKTPERVTTFNTSMQTVLDIEQPNIVSISKQLGNEDLILTDSSKSFSYDMKGMMVETTVKSGYINYRNELKQVYITAEQPGIPGGVFRLRHAFQFKKTIDVIVQEWNDANPDFKINLSGEGSEWEFGPDDEVIKTPWIPEQDIIVTADDLLAPAGDIVATDIDNNYKYILDEFDQIYRFDLNTEQRDLLNIPYPFEEIVGLGETDLSGGETLNLNTSGKRFLKTTKEGEYQYILDCDAFTIDSYDQPWYAKEKLIYKYTLASQLGINASWQGDLPVENYTISSFAMLIANNNYNGSLGNDIEIYPDGIKTLNTLVNEWNNTNRNNLVNIVEGDSSIIPMKFYKNGEQVVIKLDGGVDRDSTTTSVAFSATEDIVNLKFNNDQELFVMHGDKLTKTDQLRKKLGRIDLSSEYSEYNVTQRCMDLICEFDSDGIFNTDVVVLVRDGNTDNVKYIRLDSNLNIKESTALQLSLDYDLNEHKNFSSYETFRQLARETISDNHLTFQVRYQSYFDTDKTFVNKMNLDVSDLTPGAHHFAFAYNSNNSNLSLFVDGVLTIAQTSDDTASGAAYKFSNTIQTPILVGAEPFFNNITVAEHLKIQNYGFSRDWKLSNYRIFNEYLNFQKIKMLSREGMKIQPVVLTLPSGKRNYIDHGNGFYQHKEPSRKSENFDIFVTSDSLTGTDLQQLVSDKLFDNLEDKLPVNNYINNIKWIT